MTDMRCAMEIEIPPLASNGESLMLGSRLTSDLPDFGVWGLADEGVTLRKGNAADLLQRRGAVKPFVGLLTSEAPRHCVARRPR